MARFLLIISILISILTAGLGYFNKQRLDTTKRALVGTQATLTTSQNTLAQIKKSEAAIQKRLSATTTKLEQSSANLATTQDELKKTSEKITDLVNQLSAKDSQISTLNHQLATQEKNIKELTASMISPSKSQAKRETELTAQLAEQKMLMAQMQSQMERAQNKIQEYVRKDRERQKLQTRLGLEGKILAVNHAWNFVVLSIGDKNGVTSNAEMLVKRGNQLVGKVRITSVEPSSSIADIISPSKGQSIQPGDNVIYEVAHDD